MLPASFTDQSRVEIARVIGERTLRLAELFANATEFFPRWASAAAGVSNRVEYLKREFEVLPIYLREYFSANDDSFLALFVGERIKAFYDPTLSDNVRRDIVKRLCASERDALKNYLQPSLAPPQLDNVVSVLDRIHKQLLPEVAGSTKIVFFGDCLFLDIGGFILSPLLEEGIAAEITYITTRDLRQLGAQLKELAQNEFDLVFFSPFTYGFSPEFQKILNWRNAWLPRIQAEDLAVSLAQSAEPILALLADYFECPIFVHNASGLLRDERAIHRFVKQRLTKRIRGDVIRLCNRLLTGAIDRVNAGTVRRVHLLDEKRIVDRAGEFSAGAYFHKTDMQHPAAIGRLLAPTYVDLIYVYARLVGRKLIVCDLDNTLWKGVIGEGPVDHFHDRQRILKRLKERGVVLAILSKNDPANINWQGGILAAEDFVYSAVSWNQKVKGMQRIETGLNLKNKDFVFIDDRADERELMSDAFPRILCLDATDSGVWARLSAWADALDEEPGMDRTAMYVQREKRIHFTGQEEGESAVDPQLFAKLELKLRISSAGRDDLKRIVDLINRTNQFNLEGRRTSFREVSDWYLSGRHIILVGATADRFGDMGITCIAVVELAEHSARVLAFVLSCRVFGYGIERAVLNRIKKLAQERDVWRLEGRYTPTAQNMPCRDFFKENAFIDEGEVWACNLREPAPADPEWLTVVAETRRQG
jgi:FkbH-like protein